MTKQEEIPCSHIGVWKKIKISNAIRIFSATSTLQKIEGWYISVAEYINPSQKKSLLQLKKTSIDLLNTGSSIQLVVVDYKDNRNDTMINEIKQI